MTDQPPEPTAATGPAPAQACPWCAAEAPADATICPACGAALAQRESIGDVRIPGLTSVDPALLEFDKRPLHIKGPSPTQGLAPALFIGAVAGGPLGLATIGGVAALAGLEFAASEHDGTDSQELADVGKPSEVILQALEHERTAAAARETTATPATPAELTSDAAPESDGAAADHGMSIWRDLPVDPA